MLVVADSSPLHYLILIQQVELLPQLFGAVVVPGEVHRELGHSKAPQPVRAFADNPPGWLSVRDPQSLEGIPGIDPGEQAAICLAKELAADLLLIDDIDGRRAAQQRGIRVTGTLGVLDRAATQGMVDLRRVLADLQSTSMRVSEELLQLLLKRVPDSP